MLQTNDDEVVALLGQRPGDFARRLDHALRQSREPRSILAAFLKVADRVSTPVLLQAWGHFQTREQATSRAFFPKGNAAKVQWTEERLPSLEQRLPNDVADGIRTLLVQRFAALPSLGKVHIDPALRDHFVPFAQRSASRSLRTLTRGSKLQLPVGETIRFFCWWKNAVVNDTEHRTDLDLSASLLTAQWNAKEVIAYYNLRAGKCYHSGDITSAPKGACEFIDVDLPWIRDTLQCRYIVMSVLSFSSQSFDQLPECFAGWMMRKKPKSGEIFEPKTVQDKIDIVAPLRSCVPIIIDVVDRVVYWADLGLNNTGFINNASANNEGFRSIGRALTELRKPTLHDLFMMHAEARGNLVEDIEEAETRFGLHEGTVTAFDGSTIISEYLG